MLTSASSLLLLNANKAQNDKVNQRISDERNKLYKLNGSNSAVSPVEPNGYNTLRGIMVEVGYEFDADRTLIFPFNPTEIQDTKQNSFSRRSFTGSAASEPIWNNGDDRLISFNLHFEATAGFNTPYFRGAATNDNDVISTLPKRFSRSGESSFSGTLRDVELLMSFQYPKVNGPWRPRFSYGGHIPAPRFMPPPTIIFSYGDYYLECVVIDASFTHILFNKDLIPMRTTSSVTLKVLESSVVKHQNLNPQSRLSGINTDNLQA